jgi:hypothetical protein
MKQPKGSTKSHVSHTPVDTRQFPFNARAGATPSREAVREGAHPVIAPRQTNRRTEKAKKSQTDV